MPNYKQSIQQQSRTAAERKATERQELLNDGEGGDVRRRSLGPTASDPVESALGLIRNATETAERRIAALGMLQPELKNNETVLEAVLALLADRDAPVKVRASAFSALQMASFTSSLFMANMPAFLAILRTILDEKPSEIRASALDYLALQHDEYAQRRLVEGLENPTQQLVAPEVAIQLLSYDLHAGHFPVLYRIVENPPNALARREALRNLGADAAAQPLLQRVVQDRQEDGETRFAAALALQRLDDVAFESLARQIVLQSDEPEDFKAALLTAMTHSETSVRVRGFDDFPERLRAAGQGSGSANLKTAYRRYLAKHGR